MGKLIKTTAKLLYKNDYGNIKRVVNMIDKNESWWRKNRLFLIIGVVVAVTAIIVVIFGLDLLLQKGIEESAKIGIILSTITAGENLLYFMAILVVNSLGLYLSDHEIDKQTAIKDPNGKSYEYEWKEVIIMGFSSAILTMGLLETFNVHFWMSLVFALLMGIAFRPLLPELSKLASSKIKGLLEIAFGQYK